MQFLLSAPPRLVALIRRSLKPAKHAGQTLMRWKQDHSARSQAPGLQPRPQERSLPNSADASEGSSSRTQTQSNASRVNAALVSYPLAESPEPPSRLGRASMQPSEPDFDGSGHQRGERGDDSQVSSQSWRADRQLGPARREEAAHSSNTSAGLHSSQSQAERAASEHGREGKTRPSLDGASSQHEQHPKAQGPTLRSGIRLESVEWHSRIEKDWYAATVFVDLLTFVYVALFYQVSPLQLRLTIKIDWLMPGIALQAVPHAMSCARLQACCTIEDVGSIACALDDSTSAACYADCRPGMPEQGPFCPAAANAELPRCLLADVIVSWVQLLALIACP